MRKACINKDDETFWFAEVRPDIWIELDREPEAGEESVIHDLVNGIVDGVQGRTRPMTFATRWFGFGDEFEIAGEL